MISPLALINENPIKPRESQQGWALRLLSLAYVQWTQEIYGLAMKIAEREAARCKSEDGKDACSNIIIDLSVERKMVADLVGIVPGRK